MENKISAAENPIRLERVPTPLLAHEAGGEHTLPDYMPPIRRMVALRASVLPEGTFLADASGGTDLEMAGTVAYSLIYTDDEGKLAGVSLTSDYTANASLPTAVSEVSVFTSSENHTCRVLAPRKVSLRSRLSSEISAFRSVPLSETVTGKLSVADELHMERLPVEYRSAQLLRGQCKGLRTEGILATTHDPLRPVYCDGRVTVKSARAVADGVLLKGTVSVSCLAAPENGGSAEKPVRLEKEEAFEEKLEIPGCVEGDFSTGFGHSVSLILNTDEGADGSREISYEMVFDLEATSMRNRTMAATADLYSTSRHMACTYSEGESLFAERGIVTSVTVSEALPFKGASGAECLDVTARAEIGRKEWKDGALCLDGTAIFSVVFVSEGREFFGEEYRVPFRYCCDVLEGGGCEEVRCSCTSESARVDADKIHLGAEVFFSIAAFGRGTVCAVDTVTPGDPLVGEERAVIRVYYPAAEETLWQVGKRYHKSCRELAEENGLADGVSSPLQGVKKLIV